MIGVIDYQAGNTRSVLNALRLCEIESRLTSNAADLDHCDGVILPGVGSAGAAMRALKESSLINWIQQTEKPFLGICLGMQILYDFSDEDETETLGLIPGRVRSLKELTATDAAKDEMRDLRIPHMGWNRIQLTEPSPLFMQIPDGSHMYFAHSFAAPVGPDTIAATAFGEQDRFSAAVESGNFFGVQFHPEKSGPLGLQLLKNFEALCS